MLIFTETVLFYSARTQTAYKIQWKTFTIVAVLYIHQPINRQSNQPIFICSSCTHGKKLFSLFVLCVNECMCECVCMCVYHFPSFVVLAFTSFLFAFFSFIPFLSLFLSISFIFCSIIATSYFIISRQIEISVGIFVGMELKKNPDTKSSFISSRSTLAVYSVRLWFPVPTPVHRWETLRLKHAFTALPLCRSVSIFSSFFFIHSSLTKFRSPFFPLFRLNGEFSFSRCFFCVFLLFFTSSLYFVFFFSLR